MRTVREVQSFLMKRRNEMRLNPTPSETALKSRLESESVSHVFQSVKFSGGTYRIFDFYFPKHKVVVEVDGLYHDPEYDSMRDGQVAKAHPRYTILRFTNKQVDDSIDEVMAEIRAALTD